MKIKTIDINVNEGNTLIAKFMDCDCDVENLKYHSSWGYLMPVVEKINTHKFFYNDNAFTVRIDKRDVVIFCNIMRIKEIVHISWMSGKDTMLSMTYKAVINFIKWYNERKNDDL